MRTNWIKPLFFYSLLYVILPTAVTLVIFEVYCRVNPEKFYSYGWQNENILDESIDACASRVGLNPVVVVLGDSFVEFYKNSSTNLVKKIEKKSNGKLYCNFGISGAGPSVYKNRLVEILRSNKIHVDEAIVFLYEGNDFSDYLLASSQDEGVSDRKLPWFVNMIKGSYAINFVYREFIKRWIYKSKLDPYILANSLNLKDVDNKRVAEVYAKTPREMLPLFESNILNVSWYSVALAMPNYFERIHSPSKIEFTNQSRVVMKEIEEMQSLSKVNNIKLNFIIIPHDYFLFEKSKLQWSQTFGFDLNPNVRGQSEMSKHIIKYVPRSFYSGEIFSYEDFIRNDGHLTPDGNDKLSGFVTKSIH